MLTHNTTTWHRMSFRNTVSSVKSEVENASEKGFSEYQDFLGDIHARLLSGDSITQNEKEGLEIYRGLHQVATEVKEWAGLVERTKGSSFLSRLGTQAMAEGLKERLPVISSEASELADMERAKSLLEDQLEANPDNEQLQEAIQEMSEKVSQCEEAQKEALEGLAQASSSLRSGLKTSLKSAIQEITDLEKCSGGCGMSDGASIEQREEGLKTLSEALKKTPDLLKILELAGRFDALRRSTQNAQTQYARSEVVGIEQGNDISRLLIPEFLKLELSPELFATDFYENRLLQYRLEGKEKKGAGPIVVLVDNSGSMSGDRTTWAKAIALSLMQQAQSEKRPFALALYERGITTSFSFSSGETMNLSDLLKALSYQPNGGTDISKAISWSFSQIAEQKDADVIVISDGDDSSIRSASWRLDVKGRAANLKTRIFGVLLEEADSSVISDFKAFCCEFISVTNLRKQGQEMAIDLFNKTVKK